ncbi:MAG: dihydropteroate synthase [Deltaproteobacteria bacterium]|nr:dihydropteroate synthase [Deltaproteobacteria bacterium]MBW1847432.1 dihydropteroate synthase [Deltaproteobacteria bacterium]MBW2179681.1 dihydropteroate synthase [Deltaproteobacteria bacterium]MBW2365470.1 dihydropteroate synthase [Deltaproteobacteria bacterium]
MDIPRSYKLSLNGHTLELGNHTAIMGIVNVTPDSFSDGGNFFSHNKAVEHGEKMADEGADIIDIGGESTRPFSEAISVEEESQRVVPVIEKLAKRINIPISIDTTKADVAIKAIEAGAAMINDISALRFDENMAAVAKKYDAPLILMHMLGTPGTMQHSPEYDDLISEIRIFLEKAIQTAEKKGVPRSKVIIDPGIGFGKTVNHNYQLIDNLDALNSLDVPILIGPSRKAFIRNTLKNENETDVKPDSPLVETGTQAAIAASILKGAHIVRVHDVANTKITVKIIDAVRNSANIP